MKALLLRKHGGLEELEVVQKKDDPSFSLPDALTSLEQRWLDKLKPWAPNGYTKGNRIRE